MRLGGSHLRAHRRQSFVQPTSIGQARRRLVDPFTQDVSIQHLRPNIEPIYHPHLSVLTMSTDAVSFNTPNQEVRESLFTADFSRFHGLNFQAKCPL